MSLRFRQSFQLFPGVRINVGKSGISTSIGVPGATLNVGNKGVHATVGIPGSGLSYRTKISSPAIAVSPGAGQGIEPVPSTPSNTPSNAQVYVPSIGMREIGSASVEILTSKSLTELREIIAIARNQLSQVQSDLAEATGVLSSQEKELKRKKGSIFRWFYKKRIAELEEIIPVTKSEVDRLKEWSENTKIRISFETTDSAQRAYAALVRAFSSLKSCSAKWDITSDREANRVVERTMATRTINRYPVTFDFASNDLIEFDGNAMRFENVNGEDILLYPGLVLMARSDGAFALIDIRELHVTATATNFVEEERVPPDSQVIGHTWFKVNKDGSPDRRFKENYQIPVCEYGRLMFESGGGVTEEYQVSGVRAAAAFSLSLKAYQEALSGIA